MWDGYDLNSLGGGSMYQDWLKNRDTTWGTQTVTTNETVLNHDKLNELIEKMKLGATESKESQAKIDINEVLKDKGYPEFDEILEHYLESHPEYLL